MAYRDYPDYDRERLYDDSDAYAVTAGFDRGMKRPRSPSPYDRYRGSAFDDDDAYRAWEGKRVRPRDEYERHDYPVAGGAYSPPPAAAAAAAPSARAARSWDELDRDEKEREWARYERELEWERYHAGERDDDPYRAAYDARADDRYARYDYDRTREPEHWGAQAKSARLMDPMDSPTILPFRRYAQLLRELGTEPCALASGPEATQQLYDKYQEYRTAFNRRAMHQFWEAHKEDKWFKEKYGIEDAQVQARSGRRRAGREGRKQAWLEELSAGKLDNVCWDVANASAEAAIDGGATSTSSGGLVVTDRFGENKTLESAETVELPADLDQILIRQIPTDIGREDIESALAGEEGFLHLALGEPHPAKRYTRVGWAVFAHKEASEMQATADRLNQSVIQGQKLFFEVTSRPAQARLKIAPELSCTLPRLAQDWLQAREAVAVLEAEDRNVLWKADDPAAVPAEIKINASDAIEERCRSIGLDLGSEDGQRAWIAAIAKSDGSATAALSEMEQDTQEARRQALKKSLDLHIDLLRQVYHCDYYSSTLCDYPEEIMRRAAKHVRRVTRAVTKEPSNGEKLWASNLDLKQKLFLRPNDNEIGAQGGNALDALLLELAAPYSQEDEAEKHRCIVQVNGKECGKPFKAQIFVQKHVLNKHREWFDEQTKDRQHAARYFNNYVRDPQRVMPPLAPSSSERGVPGKDGANGAAAGAASLTARLGGYDFSNGHGHGYYGSGSLLRMGGMAPAAGNGRGNGAAAPSLYDRLDDAVLRVGANAPYASSGRGGGMHDRQPSAGLGSAEPPRRREPLPSPPKPLDPRASQAPRSYQDLDAGGPPETSELELEY